MLSHKLLLLYCYIVRLFMLILPDIPFVMRFRGWLYLLPVKNSTTNFQVAATASIRGLENLSIGDNVYIGPNTFILSRKTISISDNVLIAMNVVITDSNHGKDHFNNSYRFERGRMEPVVLGSGCWIAANCVITAGAHIESGSVVPACTRV